MSVSPPVELPSDDQAKRVSLARRRLVLGAGAVIPTFYTLSSGAQTAGQSLTCVQRAALAPQQQVARVTSAPDQWYRKPIVSGKKGNTMGYCIMDKQGDCPDPFKTTMSAPQSVWYTNNQRTVVNGGDIKQLGSYPKGYGLVYVNKDGTLATLDPNGQPDLAQVSNACIQSVGLKILGLSP